MRRASACVARHVFELQKSCASTSAAAVVVRPEAPSKWARPASPQSSFKQPHAQNSRRPNDRLGSYDRPNTMRRDSSSSTTTSTSENRSNNYKSGSMNRNGNRNQNSSSNWNSTGQGYGQRVSQRDWNPQNERSSEPSSSKSQSIRGSSPQRRPDRSPQYSSGETTNFRPREQSSTPRRGQQSFALGSADSPGFNDVEDAEAAEVAERWKAKKQKKGASALDRLNKELEEEQAQGHQSLQQRKKQFGGKKAVKEIRVVPDVYIPRMISVGNLARLLGAKREILEDVMAQGGLGPADYDRVIPADEASLIAMELGRNPIVNDEAAFDIYP
ncbi:hypothetical protein FRC02_001673, partial [Tulasnella sp. 418]